MLATQICLLGATLMLATSRTLAAAVAHGLMFVAMAVMGLAMGQWTIAAAVAVALCLVGVAMVRHADETHRATAIDSFACAALVGLMTVAMLTRMAPHAMAGHEMGSHPMTSVPSAWGPVVLIGVVLAVGGWLVATVIATPRRSLVGWGAGITMMLGMGAMALA